MSPGEAGHQDLSRPRRVPERLGEIDTEFRSAPAAGWPRWTTPSEPRHMDPDAIRKGMTQFSSEQRRRARSARARQHRRRLEHQRKRPPIALTSSPPVFAEQGRAGERRVAVGVRTASTSPRSSLQSRAPTTSSNDRQTRLTFWRFRRPASCQFRFAAGRRSDGEFRGTLTPDSWWQRRSASTTYYGQSMPW